MDTIKYYKDETDGYVVVSSAIPKHPTTVLMDTLFVELSADSIALNKTTLTRSLVVKYTPDGYPNTYATITSYEALTDLQVVLHKASGEVLGSKPCGMSTLHVHYTVDYLIKQSILEDK